jgi:hypothetical protein
VRHRNIYEDTPSLHSVLYFVMYYAHKKGIIEIAYNVCCFFKNNKLHSARSIYTCLSLISLEKSIFLGMSSPSDISKEDDDSAAKTLLGFDVVHDNIDNDVTNTFFTSYSAFYQQLH